MTTLNVHALLVIENFYSLYCIEMAMNVDVVLSVYV